MTFVNEDDRLRVPQSADPPTPLPTPRVRFGVFARFGEIVRMIVRQRPGTFLLLMPILIFGTPAIFTLIGVSASGGSETASTWLELALLPIFSLIFAFGAGLATLAGCEAVAGIKTPLGQRLWRVFGELPRMVLIIMPLLGLAWLVFFLIIPLGLWALAIFSAVLPALFFDGARWGAPARSRHLTRGYRWPIVGLILLVLVVSFSILMMVFFIAPLVLANVFGVLLFIVVSQALAPLLALGPVVHARLVAIKEGAADRDLGAVFD